MYIRKSRTESFPGSVPCRDLTLRRHVLGSRGYSVGRPRTINFCRPRALVSDRNRLCLNAILLYLTEQHLEGLAFIFILNLYVFLDLSKPS